MTLTLRGLLAATALAATLAPPATAQTTIDITVTAGHPPIFLWVKHVTETYIPAVNAALEGSGYAINWTEAFAGTIAGVGGELDALEDGLTEIALIPTVFTANQLPLYAVTYNTPFGVTDPRLVTEAVAAVSQQVPAMLDSWTEFNAVYLGGGQAIENYLLMTNFPVNSLADLQGRRIAAPGPAVNWLQGTGAVGVAGNLTTYYNDLQTGVFDGVIVFPTAAAPARLHEVAPYVTHTDMGAQYTGNLAANGDFYAGLPEVVRLALHSAADAYNVAFLAEQQARIAASLATIGPDPSRVRSLTPEERQTWAMGLPDLAGAWAAAVDARGLPGTEVLNAYMAYMRDHGAVLARDWSMR